MTTAPPRGVALVAANPDSALASAARESLAAARVEVRVVGAEALPAGAVHLLLDDPSLPQALARLIQALPAREILPEVILVVADAHRGGLLLGDGFSDVVVPDDAGQAVINVQGARPPVVFERVKRELEERLLPALLAELKLRAGECERLLGECVALLRAKKRLAKTRARLEQRAVKQAIGDGHVAAGLVELFANDLARSKRPRIDRLGRFPKLRLEGGAFATGEPRLPKRQRALLSDLVAWLEHADLIAGLDANARARLDEIARSQGRTPTAGLTSALELLERERLARLAKLTALAQEDEPRAAVTRWLAEQHGFEVMAERYAMPEHQARLIKSHIHPPPEIYRTWCLDLTNLRLVLTSDVLGAIARTLIPSSAAERRADAGHLPRTSNSSQGADSP